MSALRGGDSGHGRTAVVGEVRGTMINKNNVAAASITTQENAFFVFIFLLYPGNRQDEGTSNNGLST